MLHATVVIENLYHSSGLDHIIVPDFPPACIGISLFGSAFL